MSTTIDDNFEEGVAVPGRYPGSPPIGVLPYYCFRHRRDQEGFTGRVQGHSTGITASRRVGAPRSTSGCWRSRRSRVEVGSAPSCCVVITPGVKFTAPPFQSTFQRYAVVTAVPAPRSRDAESDHACGTCASAALSAFISRIITQHAARRLYLLRRYPPLCQQ